jgi:c-di-GMP-binding flagellar brake protein YcgR
LEKIKNPDPYLDINLNVNFHILTGDYAGMYHSRIEDVDKKNIFFSAPTSKSIPIPVTPNTEVEVSFISDKGRFSFKSVIVERIKDKIMLVKVRKPDVIYRKELRRFFRINTRLKAKLIILDLSSNGGKIQLEKKKHEVLIKDISGGGMRIITSQPLKLEQAVEFDLSEALGLDNDIFGKVVNIYSPEQRKDKMEVGIEFISIKEKDRDKIIKYVFQRQIELKKLSK